MKYWSSTLGFIAVIGAVCIYIIGAILAVISDIRALKKLKSRIMKDFRNIDRYGLKPEESDMKGLSSVDPN